MASPNQAHAGTIALNLAVGVGGLIMVAPFAWMLSASVKSTAEIFRFPPTLIPDNVVFDNYGRLFTNWPFGSWYANSLLVAVGVTLAVLLLCSMAGFAFAKYRFSGDRPLFLILLGSTMIPFQIILIPLFIVVSQLGWTNSLVSLIVPFVAPAIGIFLMRQFISLIPNDLIEAARVDGASDLGIYWRLIIPLAAPGLATLGIITFLQTWNNFLWPLTVLRREEVMTLPVGMATMLSGVAAGSAPPFGPAMAASVLVSLPIIAVFVYLQRYYIAGLTFGAVKG